MQNNVRMVFFGLLTWLIPFIIAIPFYSPEGRLIIDTQLFKSIMIVIGSGIGMLLLVLYFRNVSENYRLSGVYTGITWFILNLVLDLIILLPVSHMNLTDYLSQIGIRYLMILFMGIGAGFIAADAIRRGEHRE